MPLFTRELNELMDRIGRSNLTIYLHTAAPTNTSTSNGRVTTGGGAFASGATLTAANITTASSGSIENSVAIDFGTASANIGTVTHWSAFRGNDAVAFGTLPSTAINSGSTFSINANSMEFNGTTS